MTLSQELESRLAKEDVRRQKNYADDGFGRRLFDLRKRLNMTQEQFASSYGIPVGNIRNWEQGGRVSRPESAAVLLIRLIQADPVGVKRLVNSVSLQVFENGEETATLP